jgi:hypothetical protein
LRIRGIEIYSLLQAKLFDEFAAALKGRDWDTWCASDDSEKEEVAAEAIAELGLQIGIEDAYNLFWKWESTLTAEDFEVEPTEENPDDEDPDESEEVKNWNDQLEDPRYIYEE